MGHLPILDGPDQSQEPLESHEDGCPGAWARCGFVQSVEPYERAVSNGVYSQNVRLDRCTNELVLEAVQYLEQERARSRSFQTEKAWA